MPDHFYVYPAYLKRGGSRSVGRRVPAKIAVADAPIEEIVRAAEALGFRAEAQPDKQYPRAFFAYQGRVKVTKRAGVAKTAFLKQLAAELQRRAAAGPTKG
jgi:signal recognition particle subunit SRP19